MDTPKGEYDLDSSLFRISMVFNINTSTNNDCNRLFGNCLFYARKIFDFFFELLILCIGENPILCNCSV